MQEDNYSAVIFDSKRQDVSVSMVLVVKKIFLCLSLVYIYHSVRRRSAITHFSCMV